MRADLLERNASLELEQRKQGSVLEARQHRIGELERQLQGLSAATAQWKEQFAGSEVERDGARQELASYVRAGETSALCCAVICCAVL